jgi:hypothetical protein
LGNISPDISKRGCAGLIMIALNGLNRIKQNM